MKKLLSTTLALAAISLLPAGAEEVNASDSQGINLTVYNQNFGLVKDVRNVELKTGVNYLRFADVAAQIDPTSVSFLSLTAPNSVAVREQNYQYDLIDPTTILSKSVGKTLKFRHYPESGPVREFTGVLINSPRATVSDTSGNTSVRYQGLVIKTADGIILNPSGEIELAELPPGLVSKPSLFWKLEVDKAGQHKTEIAYQTQGMNWRSDYVSILNETDNQMDLTSWVTLDNKSGATYKNAALKLMAGDVHRVQEGMATGGRGGMMYAKAAAAPQFKEQSFAEYHLYTLQGKTDVKDNETKQLSLFNANKIPAKKLFVYEPSAQQYGYYRPQSTPNKVNVKIEVQNSEKNQLGIPLPKGKVRVYKRDTDGALQFIGEDMIDHTPRDETIRLYIGDAFDVVGEYKHMNHRQISDRVARDAYEISLRNHKDTEITVICVEHAHGDWTIVSSSLPHTKKDSRTFEFAVKVPANGETKVNYEVETRW